MLRTDNRKTKPMCKADFIKYRTTECPAYERHLSYLFRLFDFLEVELVWFWTGRVVYQLSKHSNHKTFIKPYVLRIECDRC